LQSDGVKNTKLQYYHINGQVGSLEGNGEFGVGGFGGALRIRKQLVEKFDGSLVATDVEKHTLLVQDQLIC
jgi:hypothetical protein